MADMGKTEVDAISMEEISSIIQSALIETSKLVGTVSNFQAGPGIDTIKVGRAGNFTVQDKVENTGVTPQVLTYAADSILLDQYKVIQVLLEDNAQLQATPDVVADMMDRMAKQLAYDIDAYIITKLEATSAAAPDHRIVYVGSTLAQADILAARTLLHNQLVPFNECYIGVSPTSEAALLAIADFVRADAYGSSAGLKNGELGTLYGAKVIMSTGFNTAKTMVWHPGHVGFALQMAPKFETFRDVSKLANLYSLSQLYGAVTFDGGKRGVLLGTAA